MVSKIYQHRGKILGIVLSLFITSKSENTYICICMPKSGEKKEDKMDEMVGWPDHIITYYIVGKLRLTMGGRNYLWRSIFDVMHVQLNKYETAPNFIQLNQNLPLECLLIYQFLHDVIINLFCFDLQNNFMIRSCKNW